jgi:membrane-associated phospholipid phosphatase
MVALGGATGVFIGLGYRLGLNLQVFIIPLILAAGLTAYARLYLDAHKPAQVYIGYFLGLIPIILLYLMY